MSAGAEAKPKGGLEDVVATSSSICSHRWRSGHPRLPRLPTSTISRRRRRSRRSATSCGMAACRTAPSSASSSRNSRRHVRCLTACCGSCARCQRLTRWTCCEPSRPRCRTPIATPPTTVAAANYRKAVRLTAQMGSLVAAIGRLEKSTQPIDPDPVLGHAANFLYMLTGHRPDASSVRAFDLRARPARRSRAERVDVRRTCRRRNADRYLLRHRRRHRRAEGAAPRRRRMPRS